MKPVDQTIYGFEEGNCFAACVASIFELPLEGVPNFCAEYDGVKWYDALDRWLRENYGLSALVFNYAEAADDAWYPRGYAVLSGISPRDPEQKITHSTVALDGKMVFDPHPERTGLVRPTDWIVFHVTDPSRVPAHIGPLADEL